MNANKRLIRRLRRRDERAFTELIATYQGLVFGVSLRIVGNAADAEEVAQEVFVTVFKKIDTFRGESSLKHWILRIATNHSRNRLRYLAARGRGRHDSFDDDESSVSHGAALPSAPAPEQVALARETHDAIEAAWLRIDDVYRVALTLYDVEGLSYAEVADVLSVPINTVRTRIYRGRAQWNQAIGELESDAG